METTEYYETVIRRNHPEIKDEWVERVLDNPYHTEVQPNGRIRYYGYIDEAEKWLRVILDDGKVHNRFFDRGKLRAWGKP